MKRTGLLLLLLFCFAIPIAGQADHATTPEQCRADAAAWGIPTWGALTPHTQEFAQLQVATVHADVSAKLLDARVTELMQCEKTDPKYEMQGRYERAVQAYRFAELGRIVDFMNRHQLTTQFYQEDEQGER